MAWRDRKDKRLKHQLRDLLLFGDVLRRRHRRTRITPFEGHVCERALEEAVACERLFRFTLRQWSGR